MQALVEAMLFYTRLIQRTLKISELNVSEICNTIVSQKKQTYSKTNYDIVVSPKLTRNADESLIIILLEILIDNAFKFSADQKSARIEISECTTPQGLALF